MDSHWKVTWAMGKNSLSSAYNNPQGSERQIPYRPTKKTIGPTWSERPLSQSPRFWQWPYCAAKCTEVGPLSPFFCVSTLAESRQHTICFWPLRTAKWKGVIPSFVTWPSKTSLKKEKDVRVSAWKGSRSWQMILATLLPPSPEWAGDFASGFCYK